MTQPSPIRLMALADTPSGESILARMLVVIVNERMSRALDTAGRRVEHINSCAPVEERIIGFHREHDDPLDALAYHLSGCCEREMAPSAEMLEHLGTLWTQVMTAVRAQPARWSGYQLRDIAGRLDALGALDPAARTFEVLDEIAPDRNLATFRQGYPEPIAEIILALVRHDERSAFETLLHLWGGPYGMTMDEAWEGTRRRMAKPAIAVTP